MRRVYLIPNAVTAFGLACGLFVIFRMSLADPAGDLFSLVQTSVILLLLSALADLADGAIARFIKAESEFGVQFDSLSDSVTFGVAPPIILLKSLTGAGLGKGITFFVILASMVYALCGVLRLVRYNVRTKQVQESGSAEEALKEKKHFTGLPIPAAASAAVASALFLLSPWIETTVIGLPHVRASFLIGILLLLGYLMVSRWKFPSVKALHFRVPPLYLVFATGVLGVAILYGILDFFAALFFAVTWLYVGIGWSLSIIRRFSGKHSPVLADFEPEEEEGEEESP